MTAAPPDRRLFAAIGAPLVGVVGVITLALLQGEVRLSNLSGLVAAPVAVLCFAILRGERDGLLPQMLAATAVALFAVFALVLGAITLIDAG